MRVSKKNIRSELKVVTALSAIDGTGLFAAVELPARRKLGEMTGERISKRLARRRARTRERVAIVELGDGTAIDAAQGNEFAFVNHACQPNLYVRITGTHIEFYTLRRIRAGEELTCDYGETHHDGKRKCNCRSAKCRGFI
jgi:SET domain-containing protein